MEVQHIKTSSFRQMYDFTGEQLGKGSFATVREGKRYADDSTVAVKTFTDAAGEESFNHELSIHNMLMLCDGEGYSKWMVPLLGAYYITDAVLYVLVFERAICSLCDILYPKHRTSGQTVPVNWCVHAGEQIAKGLAWLHSCSAVHCDIKPENILFVDGFGLKLADLGSCYPLAELSSAEHWYIQSRWYRAPEVVLRTRKPLDELVDVWSVGCVMVEMLKGRSPIIGNSSLSVMETIVNNFGLPPAEMLMNLRSRQECDDDRIRVDWETYLQVTGDGRVDSWFLEEKSTVLEGVPESLLSTLKQIFKYTGRPSAQQCVEMFRALQ